MNEKKILTIMDLNRDLREKVPGFVAIGMGNKEIVVYVSKINKEAEEFVPKIFNNMLVRIAKMGKISP